MATLPFPTTTARPTRDPRTEIRIGTALVTLFTVGFLGWSAFAHLDAAVHSAGVVRVAGNRQSVQSATPGIVSAIHVVDGQRVAAGQLLVEFATTEALAQERSLAGRIFGLQAEAARINAERIGASKISAPSEWAALNSADREDAMRALAGEQTNLQAAHSLLASQRAVLNQRIVQIDDQISGYSQRQASNRRQNELNQEELGSVQTLYKKGFATKARVLALQRSDASIAGEMGATASEIARLRSSTGETRLQIMQLIAARQQENSDRLRAIQIELQSSLPQWYAARGQLERTRLRAPTAGTVMNLTLNTVGGVAAAGQALMEIVPDRKALVVETQIDLTDANDLRVGQNADVNVTGLRSRYYAPLHGKVARISADSVTDNKTSRSYYTATVTVPADELARLSKEAGTSGAIKSGTPVEITIKLRARTALQYWLEPLTSKLGGALNEG